jgi:hypothetical protein
MLSFIKTRIAAFRDDTRGTVTVEAALMLPLLFWTWAAMYVFFDAYRQASIVQKAAYTVGDLLSRETDYITNAYMDNTMELYGFLTPSTSNNAIRVSVIRWDDDEQIYKLDWSRVRGSRPELTNNGVSNWHNKLPMMPHNERIILVEAWSNYDAPFTVGLENSSLEAFVFTRPRFAPQLLWQDTVNNF